MHGERIQVRPAFELQAAQVGLDPRRQALRVAVAHQDVRRGAGEEAAQFALVAAYRQVEGLGVEQQARLPAAEAQVVAEHHPVVLDVVRLRAAQVDGEDRDAPADQPAGQAVHHQPQGEAGKGTLRRAVAFVEDDRGEPLLARQARRQAVEDQAEEAQRAVQRRLQAGFVDRRAGHEVEAAGLHPPRVHGEELVVQLPRQAQPEPRVGQAGNPCIGLAEGFGGNAGGLEHGALVDAQQARRGQRLLDQADGNGAFLYRHVAVWRKWGPRTIACAVSGDKPPYLAAAPARISSMLISRMRNFWILPVTVIGNSSTKRK
ncbi:hypothetical protein D9M70_416330 [compost metagenome]